MDSGYPSTIGRLSIVGGTFAGIAGSVTYAGTRMLANSKSIITGSTLSSNCIYVFPKAGGPADPPSIVASPNINSSRFAVDESYVYVISGGTSVSRVALTGGGPTGVVTADAGETIKDIVIAGTELLLATSKRLAKVAAAGGTATTLDSSGSAYRVLTDGTTAFYFRTGGTNFQCTGGSELYGTAVAGGPSRRLAIETSSTCINDMVLDSSGVYWTSDTMIRKATR